MSTKPSHPGFLVWNPKCGYPRFTHDSLDSAISEAKRLATAHFDQTFYVLAPVAAATRRREVIYHPTVLELVEPKKEADFDDDIPF